MDRPLTHDVLVAIASAVGGVIDRGRIDAPVGTTCYAIPDRELDCEDESDWGDVISIWPSLSTVTR